MPGADGDIGAGAKPFRAFAERVKRALGLVDEVATWENRLDVAVAEDPEARIYVRQLEGHHDSQTEQQVVSGDDLAEEVERFLREQRGDS